MKDNETFAAGFMDIAATGLDTGGSQQSGVLQSGGKKTVRFNDQEALNANIEAIAKGEIEVVD
jgi:hypothetical protein